jgi:ABC-type protease/lipase transport system fused ATPase/permease subunit
MLGIWPAVAGKVRIDGADIASWDMEALGRFIGYMPQDVELFSGSIAENIARMGEVESDKVIMAAKLAGVHNLILQLPKGYDTYIGDQGLVLSGGQRQRIGLARALYGFPRIVILDEPNSNLDEQGEYCLLQALLNLKKMNSTVVLVTHKPAVLSIVDNIMVMQDGMVVMSGPRQEVLDKLREAQQQQARQQQQQQQARQQLAQSTAKPATAENKSGDTPEKDTTHE